MDRKTLEDKIDSALDEGSEEGARDDDGIIATILKWAIDTGATYGDGEVQFATSLLNIEYLQDALEIIRRTVENSE